MKAFGAKDEEFEIRINYKNAFATFWKHELKLDEERFRQFVRVLDKQEKITPQEFQKELEEKVGLVGGPGKEAERLLSDKSYLFKKWNDNPLIAEARTEIKNLQKRLLDKNIKIRFVHTLARGFDYYTGLVFEVFDTRPENRRSLFGGGRYDNLLEMFGAEPIPTVGFGMGDVTIRDFLETHKLPMKYQSTNPDQSANTCE